MKNTDFDTKRIAMGYAKRPWLHKEVMEQVKKDYALKENFAHGLDVGCGAGLSTKGLRLICNQVTGTDISPEMIGVCEQLYQEDAYTFFTAKAEETPIPETPYDVITAAGVINWVDRERFLKNAMQILSPDGLIIIYDFWITDQMADNQEYTVWYQEEYLKEFPKPPRNEDVWTQKDMPDGFHIEKQVVYKMTYQFSLEEFIDFMMIQSNVNAKIAGREKTEEEIREWMHKTLYHIFSSQKRTLVFSGYNWYVRKK